MKLTAATVAELAAFLDDAELQVRPVAKITDDHPEMDWEDAYAIQDAIRQRKIASGVQVAGLKMGLTSHAKMKQMGVEDPIYGFLTDYGRIEDGGDVSCAKLIHPKVEAEIAFVLKHELKGPGIEVADVLAATAYVLPAVEVIDSRYENFRFDLKSVVADNTSSARFVAGRMQVPATGVDLPNVRVSLEKNGVEMTTAIGAAVLGDPAQSVAMLANLMGARGQVLPAGTFIMAGALTEAIAVAPGDTIVARYDTLGTVTMRFTN